MLMSSITPNSTTDKNLPYVTAEEMSSCFWKAVDAKLKKAHMSRAELARKARLSNQSLTSAKYLKSNITIYTVLRIAEALGCSIEDLLYNHADQFHGRKDAYASLIDEVKEEAKTNGLPKMAELFVELTDDEKTAVLIHLFSLLGLSAKQTIEKLEDANVFKGENK